MRGHCYLSLLECFRERKEKRKGGASGVFVTTFNDGGPAVRHIHDVHCPAGIEDPARMVEFFRTIARFLHLPQEGRDDERALDELGAVVQRGFGPVFAGFGTRWHDMANNLAEYLGVDPLTALDLEWLQHVRILAHPRVIADLLNRLQPDMRQPWQDRPYQQDAVT